MNNIVFKALWSDYEEHYTVVIWEFQGRYFCKENAYSVMVGESKSHREITQDEA